MSNIDFQFYKLFDPDLISFGDLANDLASSRVDRFEGLSAHRIVPFVVDENLEPYDIIKTTV